MTATAPPPPPPFPTEADEAVHGKSVTLPRWLVVTAVVVAALVLLGGAFVIGYAVRGDGGTGAPSAVPTSCKAPDILGVVKQWSETTNRYYDAPSDTEEEDRAYAAMTSAERRLNAVLARCS